jgi:hypothetical protein
VSQALAAKKHLDSFTGRDGNFSVLRRPPSNAQVSVENSDSVSSTSSPVATASEKSDVAKNDPPVEIEVSPVVSSTGRVLRRPVHYKDTRR